MKLIRIFASLFLIVILASCNQGGSVTSLNDGGGSFGMWTIPGIGTKYIFQSTQSDSTSQEFDTLTILKTGQHLGGKTNVVSYSAGPAGEGDTEFYNIEQNGDFSESSDATNDSDGVIVQRFNWDTLPTGSRKTTQLETPVDTIEGQLNDQEHVVESDVVVFVGTENLSTPAGDFSTLHLRETFISIDSSLNGNGGFSSNEVTDYWFATSTGFFVKVIDSGTDNGNPDQQSVDVLFKYEPK
jgi:hypothetical protein